MNSKEKIHALLRECCDELVAYIESREALHQDRWVPAAEIKKDLELNLVSVPMAGPQRGEKGWVFGTLARMLEDQNRLEYKKQGSRAFYRTPGNAAPDF